MNAMKLIRYRIEKFKSVMDSGWVECDDVTTLVGVNEAGKSNLLLGLWKLNPAKGGEINFANDMPVKLFSELRNITPKPRFVYADFVILDHEVLERICNESGYSKDEVSIVSFSKDYDGNIFINFPNAKEINEIPVSEIKLVLEEYRNKLESLPEVGKTEHGIKNEANEKLDTAMTLLNKKEFLQKSDIIEISACFKDISAKYLHTSKIRPFILDINLHLVGISETISKPNPSTNDDIRVLVLSKLPKFVYYSNYGNLDSEIYLPHVIENMKRTDLSGMSEAKVRTLKVLFEYVKLDPKEILAMGEDAKGPTDGNGRQIREPNEDEIKAKAEVKKERDILLQSASTKLTRDFKDWWNQGNYNFDFRADGKHFRIWVSDDIRPERITLENRSTGLQWFLSFYLVFLVESQDSHSGSILLLDEAGLSLHPLAQRDLTAFFNNLSQTNQIINTTHSPFLIDTSRIERAKVVYVDSNGYSVVSNNLRAAEEQLKTNSVYAVHAALGLSVSDILLQGCKPVIVEGPSDQYYFNAIKLYLISKNIISPKEEIVFIPSGGVKGVGSLASLLSAKNEMPIVILDSDKSGIDFKEKLIKNLYTSIAEKIINIGEFVSLENAEVEDIIPIELLERPVNRLFNDVDLDFWQEYNSGHPIIPQVEEFSKKSNIQLRNGYKVDLARQVKHTIFSRGEKIDDGIESVWKSIFDKILN
jgi:AAA15 family ATPase/GTPase